MVIDINSIEKITLKQILQITQAAVKQNKRNQEYKALLWNEGVDVVW